MMGWLDGEYSWQYLRLSNWSFGRNLVFRALTWSGRGGKSGVDAYENLQFSLALDDPRLAVRWYSPRMVSYANRATRDQHEHLHL